MPHGGERLYSHFADEAEIYRWFTERFDTKALQEVTRLLNELQRNSSVSGF